MSLQGLSYTLSSLTIPALLNLPSADAAARAFDALTTSAKRHLGTLSTVSSSAFALAFLLSPRYFRHPYLLYTSLLVLSSRLIVSDRIAPLVGLGVKATPGETARKQQRERRERAAAAAAAARARMEASYEVLGSDVHSEGAGSASGEEHDEAGDEHVNGEEVRVRVESFLKRQLVQTGVAGVGFLLAVVGIWGDGVAPAASQAIVIEV